MEGSIPEEVIQATWERMEALPAIVGPRLIEKMSKEQPVLLAYLMAAGDDELYNEEERALFLYFGVVIWQIMKQSQRRLGRVTQKKMDQAMEANEQFLEVLSSDSEADFVSATMSMLESYPEPQVLGSIIEAVMEEDEDPDAAGFRDELKGWAFFNLKTALDALISSLK